MNSRNENLNPASQEPLEAFRLAFFQHINSSIKQMSGLSDSHSSIISDWNRYLPDQLHTSAQNISRKKIHSAFKLTAQEKKKLQQELVKQKQQNEKTTLDDIMMSDLESWGIKLGSSDKSQELLHPTGGFSINIYQIALFWRKYLFNDFRPTIQPALCAFFWKHFYQQEFLFLLSNSLAHFKTPLYKNASTEYLLSPNHVIHTVHFSCSNPTTLQIKQKADYYQCTQTQEMDCLRLKIKDNTPLLSLEIQFTLSYKEGDGIIIDPLDEKNLKIQASNKPLVIASSQLILWQIIIGIILASICLLLTFMLALTASGALTTLAALHIKTWTAILGAVIMGILSLKSMQYVHKKLQSNGNNDSAIPPNKTTLQLITELGETILREKTVRQGEERAVSDLPKAYQDLHFG